MNKKQRTTLTAIFEEPASPSIKWRDVEALLTSVGCEVKEGKGSRVRFWLNDLTLNIHRPHPKPEVKRYQVRAVREFLDKAGLAPCDPIEDIPER